ncbi:MAG: hypothetical protein WAN93_11360 [Solirubrobacteraceae bacterium]
MIDLGVALTWIAISAASAKGLSVFAHAAATSGAEAELASLRGESAPAHDSPFPINARSRLLHDRL